MLKTRVIKVGGDGKDLHVVKSLLNKINCMLKAWVGLQKAGIVLAAEDIIIDVFGDKGEMERKEGTIRFICPV